MERSAEPISGVPARWWHRLDDGRIQCDLCPRDCKLHEGQRAACFVRAMQGGQMLLTTYGRSSGFCIDPIEKKPLNNFYPGSSVLSFGTAGCNLACKFCQNWDISKSRDMDRLMDDATPQAIAQAARRTGARSVAFTYNDPVIFAEYAMDTADACHALGVNTVAVTAGYMHLQPAREFYSKMDAANVDLKAFTDEFYVKLCGAKLQPVLDILAMIHHETDCWLEITTLLIPGKNDGDEELKALAAWVAKELGPDVPVHFSAFHPDWKMGDIPATPPATLARAPHRPGCRPALCLHRQRARQGRRRHALSRLRRGGDTARLVPHPRLRARRQRTLPPMRYRRRGALREIRQALWRTADPGEAAYRKLSGQAARPLPAGEAKSRQQRPIRRARPELPGRQVHAGEEGE
jgi:pyruvate formate lyase activating enzyme